MIPIDPIMAAVVVIGVFIYFALQGSGKSREEYNDPYSEDRFKTPEMIEHEKKWKMMQEKGIRNDYELWLYNHRQD